MSPFTLSNDMIELLASAFIAVIIAAAIILLFNHMGNRAAIKKAQKAEKTKIDTAPARHHKKCDELSQDYLYGMVLGDGDKDKQAESQISLMVEYKKKR